jgi:hypothetical protein
VIPCPRCGSDGIRTIADRPYPDEPDIVFCECQSCGKGFDARVSWEGVEPAPVVYDRGTHQIHRVGPDEEAVT